MPCSTVAEFAYELRKTPETLFAQFKSAGVPKTAASDLVSEADKQRLLEFLKASHGTAADGERKKITLVKKSTIELKQADSTGRVRTIQVVARNKRTFVQSDEGCPIASASMQPQDESELIRRCMINGGSLAGNALAHYQIVRRNGSTMPFECNRIAAAMAKAFHDVYSAGLGGMVPASYSIVPFKGVTSWHFPVTEGRRMCGFMGKRRRLAGAMSQGFFSPEKLNLRNAP